MWNQIPCPARHKPRASPTRSGMIFRRIWVHTNNRCRHMTEFTAGSAPHPATSTRLHPEHQRQITRASIAGEAARPCRVFGVICTIFASEFFDQAGKCLLGAGNDPCGMSSRRLGRRGQPGGAPRPFLRTGPKQQAGTSCFFFCCCRGRAPASFARRPSSLVLSRVTAGES